MALLAVVAGEGEGEGTGRKAALTGRCVVSDQSLTISLAVELGEQLAQRQRKPRQYCPTVQGMLFVQDCGLLREAVDIFTVRARGIDRPDQPAPAAKYSWRLRAISPGVFPALSTSTARSGARFGIGSLGSRRPGSARWRNATSGMRTRPAASRPGPSAPAIRPRFRSLTKFRNICTQRNGRERFTPSMALSTNTPSTNSQSRSSWAPTSSTSFSVAVPGGGRNRTRSGAIPPSCSSKSARVSMAAVEVSVEAFAPPRANATAGYLQWMAKTFSQNVWVRPANGLALRRTVAALLQMLLAYWGCVEASRRIAEETR